MNDLIKALTIFAKYGDNHDPTHCEHAILLVCGISEDALSKEDAAEVERLGFFWSDAWDCWASFRFGSC